MTEVRFRDLGREDECVGGVGEGMVRDREEWEVELNVNCIQPTYLSVCLMS